MDPRRHLPADQEPSRRNSHSRGPSDNRPPSMVDAAQAAHRHFRPRRRADRRIHLEPHTAKARQPARSRTVPRAGRACNSRIQDRRTHATRRRAARLAVTVARRRRLPCRRERKDNRQKSNRRKALHRDGGQDAQLMPHGTASMSLRPQKRHTGGDELLHGHQQDARPARRKRLDQGSLQRPAQPPQGHDGTRHSRNRPGTDGQRNPPRRGNGSPGRRQH